MATERVTRTFFVVLLIALAGVAGAIALLSRQDDSSKPLVIINNTSVPPVPTLDPARVSQGAALYTQYCAACHGENLEGAPDWKKSLADGSYPPPPQDSSGHTWHHADALLVSIIAHGGDPANNSKMPAFGGRITPEEIASILDYIKSSWGKEEREYQWWITETEDNR